MRAGKKLKASPAGSKTAENALQDSERRFRAIFNNTFQFIGLLRPDGSILEINDTALEFGGLKLDEIRGRFFWDTDWWSLSSETQSQLKTAVEQAAAGRFVRYEANIRGKGGRVMTVDFSLKPIRDETGKVALLLPEGRNITARKGAEEALAESQALLDSTVNSTTDMIWSVDDRSFGILTFNRSLSDHFLQGRGLRIKKGMRPEDLFPTEEFVRKWCGFYERTLKEGSLTTEYDTYTGFKTLQLSFSIVKRNGVVFGVSVFGRDITLHKQAEMALQESEARLKLAHQAANDVVWDWDIVHDSQQWNEAGAVVFGWTDIVEHPQTGAWWVERVHPDDRQRVHDGFFAVVSDPSINRWQDEYRFRKADGTYAQVADRGYVLRDAQGKAVRMVGAMIDITERKQAEAKLNEQLDELRRWQKVMLNREGRVQELKREVNELCRGLGQPVRYPSQETDGKGKS